MYRYKQFWKIADLVGINFSDFEILFKNVAVNLILASTIFSEKWATV